MTKKQIKEFFKRLEGPEGCDFKRYTWKCSNGINKASKILKAMKISQQEQKEFLTRCRELGGHCDCEIIFNAKKRFA